MPLGFSFTHMYRYTVVSGVGDDDADAAPWLLFRTHMYQHTVVSVVDDDDDDADAPWLVLHTHTHRHTVESVVGDDDDDTPCFSFTHAHILTHGCVCCRR